METEAQQVLVAGFIEGLNVAIHDSVSIHPVFSLTKAINMATHVEM